MTVLAVVAGPILALYIQSKLNIGREKRERRTHVFKTLMATRATRLSADHVVALNMIDVEFYGNKTEDKAVIRAWNSCCNKVGVCRKAASRDAAPVEAQTAKSTYGFLSEPKGGHARRDVGGRIRRLTGDEAAHPSYQFIRDDPTRQARSSLFQNPGEQPQASQSLPQNNRSAGRNTLDLPLALKEARLQKITKRINENRAAPVYFSSCGR